MAKEKIITGIDIGSHLTKVAITKRKKDGALLQVLGIGTAPAFGMRKGVIVNINEAAQSIKTAIAEAERVSGYRAKNIIVNLDGSHILSKISKGVVAVSRADQEISVDDVNRVVEAAQAVSLPSNKEILHVLPREFIIDGEGDIKEPVGMRGVRLELNALIVECSTPVLKNIEKCLGIIGLDADAIVLSPLAASYAVLTKRQKELGSAVLDIGGATSGLAVYENGDVIYSQILPVGSAHITNDIAIGLRTNIDTAEKIKLDYGCCAPGGISKKEVLDLEKVGPDAPAQAAKKELVEIIEARLEEIFDLANKELKKIGKQELPAGVILCGGGVKLPGIVGLAKKSLKLPVQIGVPLEVEGLVDRVEDPLYATAIGLIKWNLDAQGAIKAKYKNQGGLAAKIKKFFNTLMP